MVNFARLGSDKACERNNSSTVIDMPCAGKRSFWLGASILTPNQSKEMIF